MRQYVVPASILRNDDDLHRGESAKMTSTSFCTSFTERVFVAYPSEYGNSGLMTFIVNQEGVPLQKDLPSESKQKNQRALLARA